VDGFEPRPFRLCRAAPKHGFRPFGRGSLPAARLRSPWRSSGPRKRETCRAELSRRRRQDALRAWDDEIRALLATALKKLEGGAL